MKKVLLPALSLIAVLINSTIVMAQPGLENLRRSQQRSTLPNDQAVAITLSPKNQNLGSVLFPPSSNVPLSAAKQWLSDRLQLRPEIDELRKKHITSDYPGMQVDKFDQYFKGIQVEHGTVSIAGSEGKAGLIQMEFYSIPDNFIITPAVSPEAALLTAMKQSKATQFAWDQNNGNSPGMQKPAGELVIVKDYSMVTDTICLAYKFLIVGTAPLVNANIYVHALNGTVVLQNTNIIDAVDPGIGKPKQSSVQNEAHLSTGANTTDLGKPLSPLAYTNSVGMANTLYSGTQEIYTDEATHLYPPFSKYFRLNQSVNGFNVETRDGRDLLAATSWVENSTNTWTGAGIDDTALEVHFNMKIVTDYWKKKFDRNSYDNANADVISYVHLTNPKYAANAFWGISTTISQTPTMNYGDGVDSLNILPYVSLDITAHEYGHAIASTEDMPQFVYQRESGALNEGFSDIWAACIEKYGTDAFPTSVGTKKTWLLGEEPQHGDPIRDLINPKNKSMADTYYGSFFLDVSKEGCPVADEDHDLCYVHANSSILVKWFSLITIGGKGTNDHNFQYDVTGLGFGTSDSIAYNTEKLLSPNADYHAVMNTSVNYVSFKYGAASNQLAQVMAAWRAVGVLDTLSVNNTTTTVFEINNSFNCVAVGKGGYVWAGTSGKGLFRYNDLVWEKYSNALFDSTTINKVNYRDMKTDRKGGIWIGQSGYNGINGTSNASGGVYYFTDTIFASKKYYSSSPVQYKPNVISRNVTSIWVDQGRENAIAASRGKALPQVWAVSLPQTNTDVVNGEVVGKPFSGGVAMGLTDTVRVSPNGIDYDSNFIKVATPYLSNVDFHTTARGAQTIGGNADEVWAFMDANTEFSLSSWGVGPNYYNGSPRQIMRYKASNGDSIGTYTSGSVSELDPYFTAKAIYFDKNDNRWLGMINSTSPYTKAVVVMDNHGNWHSSASIVPPAGSSLPDIFPLGTVVNNNAITGDEDGNVYIGTNNGLVVYSGGPTGLTGDSPLEDYKSYRRYTTIDGLPSNLIKGLAVDTFRHGIWLATDNGIVVWRFRGAKRQIVVTPISMNTCDVKKEMTFSIIVKGKYFNKPFKNQLITELSDVNGGFTNPTVLETEDFYVPAVENDPTGFEEFKSFPMPVNLPEGSNYRIRVRATNPAFIGSLSAPFAIKKPVSILPASGARTLTADRECTDSKNWTNYYYSNGTTDETDDVLLLSISKGTSFIGTVGDGTFNVTVTATPGAGSNFGVNVSNAFVNNPFVSMNRFWKVTPTIQPAKNVVVRFYYNTQDLQDVNGSLSYAPIEHAKLVFYKTEANPDPTSNLAGIVAPPISYTNAAILDLVNLDKWVYTEITPTLHRAEFIVTGFSGGSGGSTANNGPLNTLPLQLTAFNARISGEKTLLQWETSAEINTSYFEVQRSADGRGFTEIIGRISAAGNSSTKRNYTLTDQLPAKGNNYYRLKMVDIDGKITYSQVRLVTFNKNSLLVNVYPNPSKDVLHIENNLPGKSLLISLADMTGRKILQWTKENAPVLQVSISKLAAGSYILQVNDGKNSVNSKVEKR